MPKLEVPVFTVLMDGPDGQGTVAHDVQIRGADQLRAELEAKKQGVSIKDAMHTTYLWAWAAMVRTEKFSGGFRDFMDACVMVEQAKDGDGQAVAETVDPTQLAASGA